jgi:hypothetical protein
MDLDFFAEKMNNAHFIQPLLPNENLRIEFFVKNINKKSTLVLQKGNCHISSDNEFFHVQIIGEEKHFQDCFHSPIRLLQLVKLGAMEAKGSFRNILRVESLIQLCK